MKSESRCKAILYILMLMVALLTTAAIVIAILLTRAVRENDTYEQQISLGDQYLSEMDYEHAILCYQKALTIKEKNQTGYLRLSQAYTLNGEYDAAEDILKQGKSYIGAHIYDQMRKDVQDALAAGTRADEADAAKEVDDANAADAAETEKDAGDAASGEAEEENRNTNDIYSGYRDVVQSCEEHYGTLGSDVMSEYTTWPTGLCYLRLVDFNHDGWQELVLVRETPSDVYGGHEYTFEVWTNKDNTTRQLGSGSLLSHDGNVKNVRYMEMNGQTYLVSGGEDDGGTLDLYGFTGNSFGPAHQLVWRGEGFGYIYTIDGARVNENEWNQVYLTEPVDGIALYGHTIELLQVLIDDTKQELGVSAS